MAGALLPGLIGLQVVGGVYGAYSADAAGQAQKGYYNYLAEQNMSNARLTELAGERQAHNVQDAAAQEYSRLLSAKSEAEGAQTAAVAAAGMSGSVTAQDLARESERRANLDEMAIRYNADTQADETLKQAGLTAFNLRSDAAGYRTAGDQAARAGKRAAFSSLIGAATGVAGTLALANMGVKATATTPTKASPGTLGTPGALSASGYYNNAGMATGGRGMNIPVYRPLY